MQEAMPPFAARHRSNIFWIITETNLPSSVRSPTPRATRTDSSFPQSKAALETVRSVLGLPAPPLISPRSKLAFQATRKRRNSWKRKVFAEFTSGKRRCAVLGKNASLKLTRRVALAAHSTCAPCRCKRRSVKTKTCRFAIELTVSRAWKS